MDLSFRPFLPDREIGEPRDLALLVAAAAVARADSATVRVQAILDAPILPGDATPLPCGSFDAAVAAALSRWRGEERRE